MQKQKIIMTVGLPGSGKSTAAKALIASHPNVYYRINRDLIREMIIEPHSKIAEKLSIRTRDALILMALESGLTPIVDDTNISLQHHQSHIREVVGQWYKERYDEYGVPAYVFDQHFEFELIDLRHVPVEECIKRDLDRGMKPLPGRSVGEKVIRKMAQEMLPPIKPIEYNPALPTAITVDIDGTLALLGDRSPYAQDKYHLDSPNTPVIDVVQTYSKIGHHIIIVTGREGTTDVITQTQKWLSDHHIPYTYLFTRNENDYRNDGLIKQEIFTEHILPYFNVLFHMDDRNRVVQAIRELGIPVFQVNDGNF